MTAVAVAASVLSGCGTLATQPQAPITASPAPTTASASAAAQASQQLNELTVAKSSSMRGYSRARFPHWRQTGANCNVRDAVLRRDGERVGPVQVRGCNVVGGHWYSPYDGKTLTDPKDVDIDHVVPLANAWRSGADMWDDKRRGDFANDLTRPQLKAVSLGINRAKGDQDPAQWKPPDRKYWCQYAVDWIAVKHFWRLTVTTAEKAALGDMMGGCR